MHAERARLGKWASRQSQKASRRTFSLAAALISFVPGCYSGGENQLGEDSSSDSSSSGGEASGAGGGLTFVDFGGQGGAGSGDGPRVSLPFAVDLHFMPLGYMGAGETGAISADVNDCLPRPPGAQGNCYKFTFMPPDAVPVWGGIYWLTEPENWGTSPGIRIAPGATQIRFRAAASEPVSVQFFVGGIQSGAGYSDTLDKMIQVTLSEDFESYRLDLTDTAYSDGVLGGFGWSLQTSSDVELWLDDIRWE